MGDQVLNIVLGVVSSALSAAFAWALQAALRRRRLDRKRDFFGLQPGTECLLVVPRKVGSTPGHSVALQDVYALMELASLVRECGARAEIVSHDEVHQGVGDKAEFCIGGPTANERMAAHLGWKLPGFSVRADWDTRVNEMIVGDRTYTWERGRSEYVLLGRIAGGEDERPTFLICGQTAMSNLAAVRYLTRRQRELMRAHSPQDSFFLILHVRQSDSYGADVIELVADVTAQVSAPPAPTSPPNPPTPTAPIALSAPTV